MLNKNNERELSYLVKIDSIEPIEGKDRVECARVGGWTIMVKKGQFNPGDIGIYFEIDSKVPDEEPFKFLEAKHYKVKTQKYGDFYSQGLLMHPSDFGWSVKDDIIIDDDNVNHSLEDDSKFLTKKLKIKYSVNEDNYRKSRSVDKYTKMIQRNHELFTHMPYKWLIKREWGKKLLFKFYGRVSDKWGWPEWVKKTDEERVENMSWILTNKEPWVATEKIDGTSTTFTMKRGKFGKYEYFVCSRNVCFDIPEKKNMDLKYFDSNVYLEMSEKYHMEEKLSQILDGYPQFDWVTIQAETYGKGVQKNTYGLNERRIAAFNLVTSDRGRWGSGEMKVFLDKYAIPTVPILSYYYELPDTIDELRKFVRSEKSKINNKLKEGVVFRSLDGTQSFKCVDPEYLAKYN